MKSNTNRQNYIDALRSFAIFIVVFSHILLFSFDMGGYNTTIGCIIQTFMLPLFFFISGLFAYKIHQDYKFKMYLINIKDKFFSLIIPTIIFASLFLISKDQNPINSIVKYGFDGYWFCIVLFEMFFIYFTTNIICKDNKITDYILIFISIIGILVLIFFRGIGGYLWEILCLENLTKYFQFFAFGILCKKYFDKFISIINGELFRCILISLFIVCLILYFNDSFKVSYPLVYKGIHDIFIRHISTLVIFTTFYHYQEFFNKETTFNKYLLLTGQRTLDIYFIHYLLLPNLIFLKPILNQPNMFLVQLVSVSLIALIVISVCLIISNIIRISNVLGYYMLGVKRHK